MQRGALFTGKCLNLRSGIRLNGYRATAISGCSYVSLQIPPYGAVLRTCHVCHAMPVSSEYPHYTLRDDVRITIARAFTM